MKQETKNWFLQAEEHYSDAIFLFENGRYSLAVYCCHQALEKIIKAAIVEFAGVIPSKSHNLDRLLNDSTLTLPDEAWYEDAAAITKHFWRVRYPDYRRAVYTSKEKVMPTIEKTKEMYLWIKNKLNAI